MPARILIVDDNAALADNLRDIFEGAPELEATVATAPDGQAALAIASGEGFDVAVVDVKLPDGNGVDVVRALRKANPFGEVLLITGFATVDSALAALQAGAFAFLLKSFRPEELIATVEQALAKVSLVRQREELERRQRALFETASVLIVAVDSSDRLVLFNPKIAELTAGGIGCAPGRPFVESFIAEDGRERMATALAEARRSGRSVEVEVGFLADATPAGHRRVQWHLSAVQRASGEDDFVYGIGLDVTDRRALEKRAAESEALSAMGSLALGLAHEIRNPLNAAVLQLHLLGRSVDRLDDGDAKTSMQRRVEIVGGEIQRLSHLLTDFLELARPRKIQLGPVDLERLADGVLSLEAEELAQRKVSVTREVAPGAVARGDAEKLKQVLLNLVANSRDALKEGGSIVVRTIGGDEPGFDVEDDGPGIEASILQSIFDPFFTTKEAGTGLGLSIVRKIVDQHGGRIDIASAPGKGTRVAVRLSPWAG